MLSNTPQYSAMLSIAHLAMIKVLDKLKTYPEKRFLELPPGYARQLKIHFTPYMDQGSVYF